MSKKNSCKTISLNVRGIRNSIKRNSIFVYLKDQKALFYFLQETYSETGDELFWKNEWGGEIYFSHGIRHSKGVCTLVDPYIEEYKVKYFLSDNSGRIVLINLNYNDMDYLFAIFMQLMTTLISCVLLQSLRENVPEDSVKSQKCGTCLKN